MKTWFGILMISLGLSIHLIFAQQKPSAQPEKRPIITFVELGSVNCIPCRQMQPVMKSIEKKYGNQVKVVFYDVWKEDQHQYASKYGIRLIPTQVFLDKHGKELLRHEGFFPEKDIDSFLKSKGLKPKSAT
ncbi:MAG: thioredoxin family protein [Ignavibacteriales bacterium]|nr:thioredoxin family protein [Ignavibacteriales bacterium]